MFLQYVLDTLSTTRPNRNKYYGNVTHCVFVTVKQEGASALIRGVFVIRKWTYKYILQKPFKWSTVKKYTVVNGITATKTRH